MFQSNTMLLCAGKVLNLSTTEPRNRERQKGLEEAIPVTVTTRQATEKQPVDTGLSTITSLARKQWSGSAPASDWTFDGTVSLFKHIFEIIKMSKP